MNIGELPAKVMNLSMREYLAAPGDSRSFIVAVMEYGGVVQQFLEDGYSLFSGSTATSIGSDFDALIMGVIAGKGIGEQLRIPPEDVLGANGSRSTKAYKEWAAKQEGGIVCSSEQAWKFQKMFDAAWNHAAARSLIESTRETQASCFAEIDGHLVKVRPDGCCDNLWWDLKTTSAPWVNLARSVRQYHYGEQEWLYCAVAQEFGMPKFRMPFVFVSTQPPFDCKVFTLPEDYVEECGERMKSAMELIRLRRETGEYLPLSHGEVEELEIPDWVRRTTEVF